jgi:hypothetical protein
MEAAGASDKNQKGHIRLVIVVKYRAMMDMAACVKMQCCAVLGLLCSKHGSKLVPGHGGHSHSR